MYKWLNPDSHLLQVHSTEEYVALHLDIAHGVALGDCLNNSQISSMLQRVAVRCSVLQLPEQQSWSRQSPPTVGRGSCVMTTCALPTHHINCRIYIWRTDMRKFVGDRAREQGNVPQVCFLSLLQHATTCAVDFVQNVFKTTPLLQRVLQIEHY